MKIEEGAIASELEGGVGGLISSRLSRAQFFVLATGRGLPWCFKISSSVMLVNSRVICLQSIRFLNRCLICFICSYLLLWLLMGHN